MMFRESVQVFICLSVLISSSVSLHMIRDAYRRPLNELNGINHDTILIDGNKNAKRIPDTADLSQMRAATRNPSSNNLKYHELFPSSLSSSSSVGASSFSSSSSSPSSSLPFSVSFRSGTLARSSGTDSDGRYRWQKQVTNHPFDSIWFIFMLELQRIYHFNTNCVNTQRKSVPHTAV